ncbi:MAG: hypothetical protein ACK40G_01405 [Cytophagaceae bacterium]
MMRYILYLVLILFFAACNKDQYRGHHLHERHHKTLKDEHNNFHVRETKEVIEDNNKRNNKREKQAEKRRQAIIKINQETARKLKNTNASSSVEFDIY